MFALPLVFVLVLIPAIGPDKYTFTSPLIRNGWVTLHMAAVLAAYAALIFSLLASLLYLLQERRIKRKQPGSSYCHGCRRWKRWTRLRIARC